MKDTFLTIDDEDSTYVLSRIVGETMDYGYNSYKRKESDRFSIHLKRVPLQPPYEKIYKTARNNIQQQIEEEEKTFSKNLQEFWQNRSKKSFMKNLKTLLSRKKTKSFIQNFGLASVAIASIFFMVPNLILSLPLIVILGIPLIPFIFGVVQANYEVDMSYSHNGDLKIKKKHKYTSKNDRLQEEQERLFKEWQIKNPEFNFIAKDTDNITFSLPKKLFHHKKKIPQALWLSLSKKVIEKVQIGTDHYDAKKAMKKAGFNSVFYNDLKTKVKNSKQSLLIAEKDVEDILLKMDEAIANADKKIAEKEVLEVLVAMEGKYEDKENVESLDQKEHEIGYEETETIRYLKRNKYEIVN